MEIVSIVAGILLLALVLWDTFETIVLSKTVRRRYSLTNVFYAGTWRLWKLLVRWTKGGLRQSILVSFGPLSLLFLIATWAALMVVSFSLIHFGASMLGDRPFYDYLYFSGVTFFTLGYGDIVPHDPVGHLLAVVEAGTGFGFLAVVISYVPVMYSSFSRRETLITLLDAKAGSNPSAGELLKRHGEASAMEALIDLLKDWERWSAQQLEAYLSYPILSYYRSQHDDQSWLLSLTCILDACCLIGLGFEGDDKKPWAKPLYFQAKATFAMARHVIVDLAYIQGTPPVENPHDRLNERDWTVLQAELRRVGIPLKPECSEKLAERRAMYEPFVVALARDMFFTLPSWIPEPDAIDNWQISAWESPSHF
ncbi:MAG: potassium channel family protein [Fimbriimonadales bacterium]